MRFTVTLPLNTIGSVFIMVTRILPIKDTDLLTLVKQAAGCYRKATNERLPTKTFLAKYPWARRWEEVVEQGKQHRRNVSKGEQHGFRVDTPVSLHYENGQALLKVFGLQIRVETKITEFQTSNPYFCYKNGLWWMHVSVTGRPYLPLLGEDGIPYPTMPKPYFRALNRYRQLKKLKIKGKRWKHYALLRKLDGIRKQVEVAWLKSIVPTGITWEGLEELYSKGGRSLKNRFDQLKLCVK